MDNITNKWTTIFIMVILSFCLRSSAESIWEKESPTDGLFGLNDAMAPQGLEFGVSLTQIYQVNTRGGISTSRKANRYHSTYDLELTADLDVFADIPGAFVYAHAEGGGTQDAGINEYSVGSVFDVNGDAMNRIPIFLSELYYQQYLGAGFTIRFGKLDITGGFECNGCPVSFDGNSYANDETTQFLNGALVNNPSIPFPDYGMAAILYYNLDDYFYAAFGSADSQAVGRESGFNTAFHGADYFTHFFETGITPTLSSTNGELPGAYRFGFWYDPQPKAHSDSDRTYRDDIGFYMSHNQMLYKENSCPHDSQGMGMFFRYGYADSKRNDITKFWSIGCQYQGLLESRDNDVLGFGYAHAVLSDHSKSTYTKNYEAVYEIYYSMELTAWASLTPSIQYIDNPGALNGIDDAVVTAVRLQMNF